MCSMQCRDVLLLPCAAFCFVCWVCCSTVFMRFHIYAYLTSFQQGEATMLHVLCCLGGGGRLNLNCRFSGKPHRLWINREADMLFSLDLRNLSWWKPWTGWLLQSYPCEWIRLTTRVATHPPLTHHFNHSCQFDLLGHHCPGANEDPWAKDGLLQGAAAVMAVDVEAALRTKRSDHHGHYSRIFLY